MVRGYMEAELTLLELILEKTGIKGLSAYKIALYLLYVPF
jgi:hypothetical protein